MNHEDAVDEFKQCCKIGMEDMHYYHSSLIQLPQCLSCLALYREDKSAQERVTLMNSAVDKFNEAIDMTKKVFQCIHVRRS